MEFQELNNDQRRELVNTRHRYTAWRDAKAKADTYRGSMVWSAAKGRQYLTRSGYDKTGIRRQSSLGPRSSETEEIKRAYECGRNEANKRLKDLQAVLVRQAAIDRAVGLGRVPLLGAKIIRALDDTGMLGSGIRVLGTNALYAYEATAGVRVDPDLTTTEDIDLLLDSRGGVTFLATEDVSQRSLLRILQKVDQSFQKSRQAFRATNKDGYLVDLIKPVRHPPWTADLEKVGTNSDDLIAAEIEGLAWHENAPSFEAIAVDEKGGALRIVTSDPRVWFAHKFWLSKRPDRDPVKRTRDGIQARAVAQLVKIYFTHLPFDVEQLKMLPKNVFDEAKALLQQV